ncbi:MAG: triose-phosphate isomerase [Patescibacteria group bacterium]|nr:MAG: triose-phosphate isomerase [Patescibacteria group bacterium]
MIFVNFKTYEESTGSRALVLAKELEKAAKETGVKVVIAAQATDIREIKESVDLEVWSQKIDPVSFGAHTGAILPEAVVLDGGSGTFLNHSESKFNSPQELAEAKKRADEAGLKTLIFASNLEELEKVCVLKPNFVSYEPPELIGSKTTSVAQAQPEIVAKAVKVAGKFNLPLIVGAGIHSNDDVKKSLELGAFGVAVSSDIVKSENPYLELKDLCMGFKI